MKTLPTLCALLLSVAVAGAAEQQVWVPGHWQVDRAGERVWENGYYTTAIVAEPAPTAPQPVWAAGRWIWQNNAWVWQEGHWELPASQPAPAAPVVVESQPTVVVERRAPVVVYNDCPPPVYVETCRRPVYCPAPVVVDNCRPRSRVDVVVRGPVVPLPLPPLIHGSIHGHGFVGLPFLPPIPTPHELHRLFH